MKKELTEEEKERVRAWAERTYTIQEIRAMLTCPLCVSSLKPVVVIIFDNEKLDPPMQSVYTLMQSVYTLRCENKNCIFHTAEILAEQPKKRKEGAKEK